MIKITVGVEGMMCGMCEAHMNDAVRNNFKVKKVESSHKEKKTVILTAEDIDKQKMGEVVCSLGYTMTSFEKQEQEKKGLFSFKKK